MSTAEDRGWGPGWPNCQTEKWSWYEAAGHRWLLRDEPAPVLLAFIKRFHAEVEPLDPAQCWSAACRAIRGSTSTPSEHSWAKAVDLNSAKHPRGAHDTFTDAQVRRIRAILAEPMFRNIRWGIDFDYVDEHHFEYIGTPSDAAADAALLEDDLTMDPETKGYFDAQFAALKKYVDDRHDLVMRALSIVRVGDDDPAPGDQRPNEPGLRVLLDELRDISAKVGQSSATSGGAPEYSGNATITFRPKGG